MTKYSTTVIVNADVYEPGMEDGFNTYAIGGQFTGYFEKESALPKNCRVPVVKNSGGIHEISSGDYIVTGVTGERFVCKPDTFNKIYQRIEE